MEIIGKTIFGTPREFEENGVELNGVKLTQVAFGALAQHKIVEYFAEGPKPARGRSPKVYKAESRPGVEFKFPEA